MMKNRDTASNPYRVPQQPTPRWVKVSIIGLFLSNVALIGGVVFLVFSTEQCTKMCRSKDKSPQFLEKAAPNVETMAKDGTVSAIVLQEESIREVTRRVDDVEKTVSSLQSRFIKLNEFCRKVRVDATKSTSNVVIASPNTLTPRQTSVLEMITKIEVKINNVGIQLKEHIENSRQLCKEGHYRYGVYCFYVGEAYLNQASAKSFCSRDHKVSGNLVMLKDKFVHEHIAGKLPNLLHSYWIGIEKQPQRSALLSTSTKEDSEDVPSPLVSDANAPSASSSQIPSLYDYVDGTRVQNKVWQMWGPKANRYNMDDRQRRDCVALTYDRNTRRWHWQDHDCGSKLGYVCQYYILSGQQ